MIKSLSPVSLVSQYFLSTCFNKSNLNKVFTYSADLSQQSSGLNAAREFFLHDTELTISSFQSMNSMHQISTKIRHSDLPIQYFIFERALVLSKYEFFQKDPPEDFLDTERISCHMLYSLLQPLWDDTLNRLDDLNIDLNSHLSRLFHSSY